MSSCYSYMLMKCFTFPIILRFSSNPMQSHCLSLSLSIPPAPHPPWSPQWPAPLPQRGARSLTLRCCFTIMVFFFLIALYVPLLSPTFSVPLLHWRGQMLAGMIAEPAFLSEYTIFALDHSKRPQTAQVASVVSLSSLPVSLSSSFSSSCFLFQLLLPCYLLRSLCLWEISRGLWLT